MPPADVRISGHGLSVAPPHGWHARIARREGAGPVLHLATLALLDSDGDFGGAATARMHADAAFAALIRYRVDAHVKPHVGLFGSPGWSPRLRPGDFGPAQLQVIRPGQIGMQRFFTQLARPFCLYAVVQPVRERPAKLIGELSAALATIGFDN
jgi:hypothetical protein